MTSDARTGPIKRESVRNAYNSSTEAKNIQGPVPVRLLQALLARCRFGEVNEANQAHLAQCSDWVVRRGRVPCRLRARQRPDHRAIRAHSLGSEGRRSDTHFRDQTNERWIFVARIYRWSFSI